MRKPSPASGVTLLVCGAAVGAAMLAARARQDATPAAVRIPLVTGKYVTPAGVQADAGSFPCNARLTPDGRFVVVTSLGARSRLSVLAAADGKLVSAADFDGPSPLTKGKKEGLFYGLAFGPTSGGQTTVYASQGADDRIAVLTIDSDGAITRSDRTLLTRPTGDGERDAPPPPPLHAAGIATSRDGGTLYVANNGAAPKQRMTSSLSVVDVAAGVARGTVPLPGYPFDVAAVTSGPNADKVYVSSEQDGTVSVVDPAARRVTRKISTGANPTSLLLDRSQAHLFVANSGSDTVSIIRTDRDSVERTILLRPADVRGLPAATPLGLALSSDEKTLYVALADMNAVAVIDVDRAGVSGYIPAGWYPTAVVASTDGRRLFVTNAKGIAERNPNGKPVPGVKERPQYIQNIIEGTVSTIDLAAATADLSRLTGQVIANNNVVRDPLRVARAALKNPGIEHVVYIIKENRAYDQVLGDMTQGNGDPSLTLFGRDVTPNLHALAERFVLLDNFYCAAEVSGDGWNWSTQAMANEYDARNVVYGYTGKNRSYDYEGNNHGVPVDLLGITDVARAPGGYIWDNCARHRVSFRNYGFFTDDFDLPRESAEVGTQGMKNAPTKKALTDKTCADFREFDLRFADSEAWVKHGLMPAPKQMVKYGSHDDPSRITTWRREFDDYVKKRNLPRFLMVRLGRDHTSGTTVGTYSPRAMVADNDYAVGQLVEAVSRSPYWKSTAIFIVEDDAQNGYDHIDAHRSIAFVVSPFVRPGSKDSRFYNTASVLHTMENLLGLPPMNLYDATAPILAVFADEPVNAAPFDAILPDKAIVGEVNTATAYRSRDSARLLNRFKEESAPDEELNDILWHSIKGRYVPAPARRYGLNFTAGDREN